MKGMRKNVIPIALLRMVLANAKIPMPIIPTSPKAISVGWTSGRRYKLMANAIARSTIQ
jgi:hypothetical protein